MNKCRINKRKDKNNKGSVKETKEREQEKKNKENLMNNQVQFELSNPKTLLTLLRENQGGTP